MGLRQTLWTLLAGPGLGERQLKRASMRKERIVGDVLIPGRGVPIRGWQFANILPTFFGIRGG
jgi:hypothetical protein